MYNGGRIFVLCLIKILRMVEHWFSLEFSMAATGMQFCSVAAAHSGGLGI